MAKRNQAPGERISEAEHAVMEVLWDKNPLSATDVCDAICTQRDWSIATVKTLLSRLVQKEAVGTEPQGRKFLYRPLIERSDYVGGESRRLVDRLFGGSALVAWALVKDFRKIGEHVEKELSDHDSG